MAKKIPKLPKFLADKINLPDISGFLDGADGFTNNLDSFTDPLKNITSNPFGAAGSKLKDVFIAADDGGGGNDKKKKKSKSTTNKKSDGVLSKKSGDKLSSIVKPKKNIVDGNIPKTIISTSDQQVMLLSKIAFSLKDIFRLTETGQEKTDRINRENLAVEKKRLKEIEDKNKPAKTPKNKKKPTSNKLNELEKKSEAEKKKAAGGKDFLTKGKGEKDAGGFFGKIQKGFKTVKKVFDFITNSISLIVEIGLTALGVFALFSAAKKLFNDLADGVDPLMAIADAAMEFLTKFLTTIPDFIKGMISGLAAALGFDGISKFLDDFSFEKSFRKMMKDISDFFADMFVTVIQFVNGDIGISDIIDKIAAFFLAPFDFLKDMLAVVLNIFGATDGADALNGFSITGIFKGIRDSIFSFLGKALDVIVKLFTNPLTIFNDLKKGVMSFINNLIENPLSLFDGLLDTISTIFNIASIFIKINKFTMGLLIKGFNLVTGFIGSVQDYIIDKLGIKPLITMINSFTSRLIDNIIFGPFNLLKGVVAYILGLLGFDKTSKSLKSFSPKQYLLDIIKSIKDFVIGLVDSVIDAFSSGPESIGNKISKLVGKIGDMAANLLKTLLRAILPKPGGSLLSIAGIASRAIPDSIYKFAGINPRTGKDTDTTKKQSVATKKNPLGGGVLDERAQEQLNRVLRGRRRREEALAKLDQQSPPETFKDTSPRSSSGDTLMSAQNNKRNNEVALQSVITDASNNESSSVINITNNGGSTTAIGQTSIPDRAGRALDVSVGMF